MQRHGGQGNPAKRAPEADILAAGTSVCASDSPLRRIDVVEQT
jgi:hypothetical protein